MVIATGSDATLEGTTAPIDYLRVGDDMPLLTAKLREDFGVRSILCEGGPTLNSFLLAAGLVDGLFLTLPPEADRRRRRRSRSWPEGASSEPAELELVSVGEGEGDLFTRWRITRI